MSLEAKHPIKLNALYQQVILDHYKKPRNRGRLPEPAFSQHLRNPTCGDDIEIQVELDAAGRVKAVTFQGRGCSISMASASMMTEALRGKTPAEAVATVERFKSMMRGEPGSYKDLGELQALTGVSKFPVRIKCATLAWSAFEEGLAEHQGGEGNGQGD